MPTWDGHHGLHGAARCVLDNDFDGWLPVEQDTDPVRAIEGHRYLPDISIADRSASSVPGAPQAGRHVSRQLREVPLHRVQVVAHCGARLISIAAYDCRENPLVLGQRSLEPCRRACMHR